ncbi:MAG: serine/threonine-protein kinase PknD, partial [Mycobacterium sp.]
MIAIGAIIAIVACRSSQTAAPVSYLPQIQPPFTGLRSPSSVAVDKTGNIYVANLRDDQLLKAPARFHPEQIELPFTGLDYPDDVAVDTAGNVYVTDRDNKRVLKLAAGATTPTQLPFTD